MARHPASAARLPDPVASGFIAGEAMPAVVLSGLFGFGVLHG